MKFVATILLVSLASACTSAAPRPDTSHPAANSGEREVRVPTEPRAPSTPPAWRDLPTIESNGGSYVLAWRAVPDPIPRGAPWSIDVWIFAARDRAHPLNDVRLDVDAEMPEHMHGMNRVPRIEKHADGGFRVEGLYFHMPGRWELYFDVTSNAITERAQVKVELE